MKHQERWQLSDNGAESYERFQVPSVFEPLARLFLGHVPLNPGDRLLDVACGTGIVARLAVPVVGIAGRVAGVDLNAGMLEVAKRQAPPDEAEIDWRLGDAAALPFLDSSFDVVLCQQGLQFFPDKLHALLEMRRVMTPGGRLALCIWRSIEHSPCNLAISTALARHVGADAAKRMQAPHALGDPTVLRTLIGDAGFDRIEIHEATVTRRMLPPEQAIPGHLASTPVGPDVAALDAVARLALIDDITADLGPYRDTEGLAIPQGTHIVLARKPEA